MDPCRPVRVSVIIPTLGRPEFLERSLASVRAVSSPSLDLEVIVVDDSPGASAAAMAARLGARCVTGPRRGTAGAARNAGLARATGDFVAFLDDDDAWTPAAIHSQLAAFAADPSLGAVLGRVQTADELLQPAGVPWPASLDVERPFRAMLSFYPQVGATLVRTELALAIGPFDPSLVGDEDWDWHLRLARQARIGFVPEVVLLFRQRTPADAEAIEWSRLSSFYRVLFRNLLRAGPFRWPPPWTMALLVLRKQGAYYACFAASARGHARAGDRGALRRALVRSAVASPIHFLASALRGSLPLRCSPRRGEALQGLQRGEEDGPEVAGKAAPFRGRQPLRPVDLGGEVERQVIQPLALDDDNELAEVPVGDGERADGPDGDAELLPGLPLHGLRR